MRGSLCSIAVRSAHSAAVSRSSPSITPQVRVPTISPGDAPGQRGRRRERAARLAPRCHCDLRDSERAVSTELSTDLSAPQSTSPPDDGTMPLTPQRPSCGRPPKPGVAGSSPAAPDGSSRGNPSSGAEFHLFRLSTRSPPWSAQIRLIEVVTGAQLARSSLKRAESQSLS
jgi:hypothetical protein